MWRRKIKIWFPNDMKMKRIKTNNQELLIRKQNESDATSKCIEFQKTSLITVPILLRFCKWDFISNTKYNFISNLLSRNRNYIVLICRKFQDDRKVVWQPKDHQSISDISFLSFNDSFPSTRLQHSFLFFHFINPIYYRSLIFIFFRRLFEKSYKFFGQERIHGFIFQR